MPENSELIFQDMEQMLKKLKKPVYEANMERFRSKHGDFIDGMVSYVKNADEPETAVKTVADAFMDDVIGGFSVKGRIGGRKQADLNFFMIYYVFPAILLTHEESAESLCNGIRDAWNSRCVNTNINYTTYEKLYDSFRNKIFGLF